MAQPTEYRIFSLVTVLFFAFLYIPVGVVIFYAFNENEVISQWGGFSLKWFESAVQNKALLRSVKVSLTVAFFATIIATSISVVSALLLDRSRMRHRSNISETLIQLPLLIPEIVLAVSVLIFFSQLGIRNSMIKLIIAHATFCTPFAFLPIRARLQGMNKELEQASYDLYANTWTTFRLITVPLLMPGIFAGAMLSFIISMDDFITSVMVSGGGATTLPVYIFSLVKMGVTPELNAISTIIMGVSLIVVTIAFSLIYTSNKLKKI